MTLTFPVFEFSNVKQALRAAVARQISPAADTISDGDNRLAEGAYLRELMCRHPEAIQSDLGLMAMMTQYPRHF